MSILNRCREEAAQLHPNYPESMFIHPQRVITRTLNSARSPATEEVHKQRSMAFISIEHQTFELHFDGGKRLVFPISSGKPDTPTPRGNFAITEKQLRYKTKKNKILPFFMRLNDLGVGIHAGYISGKEESGGCLRLKYPDADLAYQHLKIGDSIEIK